MKPSVKNITAKQLSELEILDRVIVYRDLDHAAWTNPNIDDFVGVMRVISTETDRIRLSNGDWYSRHNGTQLGDALTFIKKLAQS